MERIAVLTDSVACIPKEMAAQYNITVVPAGNIYHNGRTYRDLIDLSFDEAYDILHNSPEEFFTGPTSPGEFLELYRELSKNFSAILYVALSRKLSTVQNAARVAAGIARKELPGLRIEVFDSATATAAEGFIAVAAAKAVGEGANFREVIRLANSVKKSVDLFYVLDTIEFVYRTGRIPRSVAVVGSRFKVKPLVTLNNGAAQVLGLVRNRGRAIDSLIRVAGKKINNRTIHAAVLHARAENEAEELRKKLSEQFNCIELWVGEFSPLMVYATGKGIIGLAFYPQS